MTPSPACAHEVIEILNKYARGDLGIPGVNAKATLVSKDGRPGQGLEVAREVGPASERACPRDGVAPAAIVRLPAIARPDVIAASWYWL
jgi:hypothetical protein